MSHVSDGQLRQLYDHELSASEQAKVQRHLDACEACRQQAEGVFARAAGVQSLFATLALDERREPLATASQARARLEQRLKQSPQKEKEDSIMWNLLNRYRTAWAGLAAILVLSLALTLPPVQALAQDFLGLFRVQQITIVEFDPANFDRDFEGGLAGGPILSDEIDMQEIGETQKVATAAEASAIANIPVRLPTNAEGEPSLVVQKGANVTFDIDLARINALLAVVGQEVDLPDSLDGQTISANLPQSVMAAYGAECEVDKRLEELEAREEGDFKEMSREEREEMREERRFRREARDCTVLMQVASPSLEGPDELPLGELGAAFLQVMGMSPEEAAKFSASLDWSSTLVIPIPRDEATYREVSVDGVTGTLIQESRRHRGGGFVLMWVKDGILYGLTGSGNGSQALEMANSLR